MLKFIIAFIAGKIARFVLRLSGRRGTHVPGKIAIKICPDFLKFIGKPKTVICVTGTNGKTSTANMTADSLRALGVSVADNSFGSNTVHGISSAMLQSVNLFNKPKVDAAVLEVDERSSVHIYKYITPTYLICTNLFRDSLMRNAHTEYIFGIIDSCLPEQSVLILNGDDIISSRLGRGKNEKRVFFSVDKLAGEETENYNIINDSRSCPDCGGRMDFEFKRYHHIGRVQCPVCGLKSPESDYRVLSAGDSGLTLLHGGENLEFPTVNNAVYNIYNEAAVIALLTEMGYSTESVSECLKSVTVTGTRYKACKVGKINLICTMLKGLNPIACSRNCHTAKLGSGSKAVFLMIDDVNHEREDCENVSWHYEADYEQLNDISIKAVYIAGPRAEDLKYRLLLAGIDESKIKTGRYEQDVIKQMTFDNIDTLFVFYDMFRFDELENRVKPEIIKRISA
ncbi:MAG: MurT ligase domain-containing protein [Clostridiales bacterium]|nr:MurT ligase domain-containing protein [Clostridiales bacterium]